MPYRRTHHITQQQYEALQSILNSWDGHQRFLPLLTEYCEEHRIPLTLYGGLDHIDEDETSITIHDRGCNDHDGTARYRVQPSREKNSPT